MKKRLLQALSRLASTAYQDAYMVNGNQDQYVVPEDLVEDVASLGRLAQRTEFASGFDSLQAAAVSATLYAIGVHGRRLFASPVATTAARLVREDEDWAAMRNAAAKCLATFGIDATALKPEEVDRDA